MKRPVTPTDLTRIPLFSELDPRDLEPVAAGARTVSAEKGETVVEAGAAHRWFYWVRQGQIRLSVSTASAEEKVVMLVSPGQTFGEALLFTGRPYPVSAVALSRATLVAIPHQPVLRLAEEVPGFALRMAGGLARRLHELVADVESYALHSGTERVLTYLAGLAPAGAAVPARPVRVRLPADKGTIASRLSLKPETLSRILRRLADEGVLVVSGRDITLLKEPDPGGGLL
ncbi:Crp/Fnr family transcriptional regulator [Streptomyces sp. NPDC059917]|uniref:Crp/Fnr family transcriptional regulator n=1 Tax=Streptomyces sp. NPDC059917 TaxID=3347002 RepID=UPI003661D77D